MQLIAPDILAEARGLTPAMTGTLGVIGLALWIFGWRWHRFWIVAGMTLTAGLVGLNVGRAHSGTQLMAIGLLLAVSVGMMAMELAKVLAFVAGGCGAWLAVQWVFPQAQELWAVFLCGGLFGILLYRLWAMLLTSLVGVLLAMHAALLLAESIFSIDAVRWATEQVVLLNGLTVGLVVLGVLIQAVSAPATESSTAPSQKSSAKDSPPQNSVVDKATDAPVGTSAGKRWWRWRAPVE
ncbi:MAG: hypothetical protein RMJ56_00730 [Gemmataceae bacterium]|nr:hypothetical protein [Gemmata sp.]MDW8196105.1 hypothetical protein [Gemmataceae bacterium]